MEKTDNGDPQLCFLPCCWGSSRPLPGTHLCEKAAEAEPPSDPSRPQPGRWQALALETGAPRKPVQTGPALCVCHPGSTGGKAVLRRASSRSTLTVLQLHDRDKASAPTGWHERAPGSRGAVTARRVARGPGAGAYLGTDVPSPTCHGVLHARSLPAQTRGPPGGALAARLRGRRCSGRRRVRGSCSQKAALADAPTESRAARAACSLPSCS